MGPGGADIPPNSQGLLGKITVKDLIGDDLRLSIEGTTARVSGEVKTLTEPWKEFDKTNNTGHFVPIKLPEECKGKKITLKGRGKGDRTVTVGGDLALIARLENLSGTTMEIWLDGALLMTVDFTETIPVGAAAYDQNKTDFGGFGKLDDYVQDLAISWDGVTGHVTGTIKNHGEVGDKKVAAGHHFPFGMSAWFADGIEKTVTVSKPKKLTDKDVIAAVADLKTPIRVEYHGVKVLEFDLTGAILAPGE